MKKSYTVVGLCFVFLSIILGAIAAHSLEKVVSADLILTFEKGVKYMIYSGLGLLAVSLNHDKFNFNPKWAYLLITIGTILFSGNIFIYIFHEQVPSLKSYVHVVPIGGFLMIIGWGVLLWNTVRKN